MRHRLGIAFCVLMRRGKSHLRDNILSIGGGNLYRYFIVTAEKFTIGSFYADKVIIFLEVAHFL
jgi:hypothetical protein